MGMEITKSFAIHASADAVWAFLIDPYRVARCLPGAALTEKIDDQTYAGTITVKVGPVTASYRGKLHFDRLDSAAREADLSASGQETRGKGGADMRMKSRVAPRGPGDTEVTVVSDVNVVGVCEGQGVRHGGRGYRRGCCSRAAWLRVFVMSGSGGFMRWSRQVG